MKTIFKIRSLLTSIVMGSILAGFFLQPAFAISSMTHASVIEYNMLAGGTSQLVVAFTAGAADGPGNVTVNFTGWTGGAAGIVNPTQSVSTTGCQSLTGATNILPGSLLAGGSSSIVTVSGATAVVSGQSYCFDLNSAAAVTNPTTVGQSIATITYGTDSAKVAVDNISNDTITVSATVDPSFTLALSGTTDAFTGGLSSTATTATTGVTATVNTNATSGWGLWAEDSQTGLHSAFSSHTINSVATGSLHTFTTGSEQYGLGVSAYNTTNYAYGAGTTGSGLSNSSFNQIATSAAPAANATTVIHELADVSGSTQAAQDYSDVVTVVGAGSF
jgi:hypothetical protein